MTNSVTGTILLVSGDSKQAKAIQAFQKVADKESGIYNHSGILYQSRYDIYVAEEAPVLGRKFKAALKFTPLKDYIDGHHELLFLVPPEPIDERRFEGIIFECMGIPYDYKSLLHDQIIRTLQKEWVGRKQKGWKQMVCHEWSQYAWYRYAQRFPEYYKGDVSKLYHDPFFTHSKRML